MDRSKMCDFSSNHNTLPHWKCVLWCCLSCSIIVTTTQELHNTNKTTYPTILFHMHNVISRCKVHDRRPIEERKSWESCSAVQPENSNEKVYSRKELVLMEKYIFEFHENNYIPSIENLYFHLPHICILGTQHFGKEFC